MATTVQEMEDISRINGALLVNIGTLVSTAYEGMVVAGECTFNQVSTLEDHSTGNIIGSCANAQKKPVVFDPVGVGASYFRQSSVNSMCEFNVAY